MKSPDVTTHHSVSRKSRTSPLLPFQIPLLFLSGLTHLTNSPPHGLLIPVTKAFNIYNHLKPNRTDLLRYSMVLGL